MNNKVYGYARVSTVKQGEHGVSLQEQKDAIARYAATHALEIVEWFEERQTAAKQGRPIFTEMLRRLKRGNAAGVIIHKIDRSARNLRDWAAIGELIDRNIAVHFAGESVDLRSRGGRLSADILAVVSADYVRNLREETMKGIRGRLKQGIYPFGAPIGYLNRGKGGKLKEIDPVKGPLVKAAFELYATGNYTLHALRDELDRRGLRNAKGGRLSITGVSTILNNPFYIGVIRFRRHETYLGKHEPVISHALFERVQRVLRGLTNVRIHRHDYLYRRRLRCATCSRSLIASRHKGHVYYRCQTRSCPTTVVREEVVLAVTRRELARVAFTPEQLESLRLHAARLLDRRERDNSQETARLQAAVGDVTARLNRLVDLYVEGGIAKDLFETRQQALVMERSKLDESLELLRNAPRTLAKVLEIVIDRAASALDQFEGRETLEDKRALLDELTSNRTVTGKNVELTLAPAYEEFARQREFFSCALEQDIPRTCRAIIERLIALLENHPEMVAAISTTSLTSTMSNSAQCSKISGDSFHPASNDP